MTEPEHIGKQQHEIDHVVQSNKTLITTIVIATILAAISLTIIILPSEYNIDPTGIGSALGLTVLADPTPQAPSKPNELNTATETIPFREDSVDFTFAPGEYLEFKLEITQGNSVKYNWQATGDLFFDFHGEPTGDTSGYFESYTVATADKVKGQFTAPFHGSHGWYWKNKTNKEVTVTLNTSGNYIVLGKR